jgi:hypothetical protein
VHYLTCKRLWRAINTASRGPAYVANILNLPYAELEQGWRSAHTDIIRPSSLTGSSNSLDHDFPPPPVLHADFLSSSRLCVTNAIDLSCTRLAVASIAYHELKHYHGLRNRNAKFIASTTKKVDSAAFKKVTSVLKTLSPSKDTTDEPSPIVPTFANISHFRFAFSNNSSPICSNVFNNSHNFTSRSSDLIIGNSLRYPPSRGKTNSLFRTINLDDPNPTSISPSHAFDCDDPMQQEFGADFPDLNCDEDPLVIISILPLQFTLYSLARHFFPPARGPLL